MKRSPLETALYAHLSDLERFQAHLFEQGHTFWFCDAQYSEHNKPFYYYQINRTRHMATCGTCYELIENRKKIRAIQKQLGIELTPLTTNFKETKHVKRMSVSSASDFNPNHSYLN